jgi:hypothetical protein
MNGQSEHVIKLKGNFDNLKYILLHRPTHFLHLSKRSLKIGSLRTELGLSEVANSVSLEAAILNDDQ